MCEKTRI
ncbi:hypothetical protein JMJ77_0006034 [Colletotrichum scovillei]|nr:hypothetical protein JMJ77_0006034 [Colletotrichum scovillei]KAG7077232.1 hypothetical protein JMJ76_0014482 [Colletotrichum scovillei]KAG7084404.1 hypothetical protein JMJ78_0009840 [Colletotrichum scovillei]